jgi:hypothetical protein
VFSGLQVFAIKLFHCAVGIKPTILPRAIKSSTTDHLVEARLLCRSAAGVWLLLRERLGIEGR